VCFIVAVFKNWSFFARYSSLHPRSREDKSANPERLSIDNRQLSACPVLEGEERLRLLNYQNNNIQTISNVGNLPNLIFLDLYNNSIKALTGLQSVTQLRVLMLGKNKISKVPLCIHVVFLSGFTPKPQSFI